MPGSHLTLRGRWVACHATRRACPRLIHLPLSPTEAIDLPNLFLFQLVEAVDPPTTVARTGIKQWQDARGRPHREHDLPAIIHPGGEMRWMKHGQNHREHDLPAVLGSDGSQYWYTDGAPTQRPDRQPNAISGDGIYYWYDADGSLDSVDDLPAAIHPDGTRVWYENSSVHREHGPAVIHGDGTSYEYWEHDLLHATDGPAVRLPDGTEEWWHYGERVEPPEDF